MEHDSGPRRSTAPEQSARERIAPRNIVDGPRGARERRRSFVTVEFDAPKIEYVEDINFNIIGYAMCTPHVFHRLCDCHGRRAMSGAYRGMHNGNNGPWGFACR